MNTYSESDEKSIIHIGHYSDFGLREPEVANPFLHPSLSEYDSLVSLFRTERNLIRIDSMTNGSFRYAAWPKDAAMQDKPELVILGGILNEESAEWVFIDEGIEYHCTGEELFVIKSGKEIARWKKR